MDTSQTIDLTKLYQPEPKQRLAHSCVERFPLYGGAVGGGKSAWLANEAIQLSLDYPGNVGYLCRHELVSFKRTTLLTLQKFLDPALIVQHHETDHYFRLLNDSIIYYGGLGDDKTAIDRINSMDLGWFGIDQIEETTEKHFLMLASRLRLPLPGIRYKGLGTANPAPGWVRARWIEDTKPNHTFIPALPSDNPYLPPDYEDQLRELYPLALVKQLLEGDWDIDAASNYLIPYSLVKAAVGRELVAEGEKVAGLDVARFGDDETVWTLRKGDVVQDIVAWHKQDTTFSAGKTADLIRVNKPTRVNIDVIGLGAGVVDPLINEKLPVRAINVGEASSRPDIYANKRAEYYNRLAKRFEKGTISIPDFPKLQSQLAGIKYTYDTHQRLKIESKEDMKKRGAKSPDYADSLMLAFLEEERMYATGF